MIKALTRRCLGGADPTAPEVRQRCGTLAGGVGILLNTLLCLGKLGAGLLTGSIAVVADGLNNLSDASSNVRSTPSDTGGSSTSAACWWPWQSC